MTGPFELVGDAEGAACVDGVCALPTDAVEAAPEGATSTHDQV